MIISHKYKFIFICNGRTGTTSIEAALKSVDESCDLNNGASGLWVTKHIPPAVLKSFFSSEIWDQYFKFVFVRHPLDWFVSQYRHNFPNPSFPSKSIMRRPWQTLKLIKRYKNNKGISSKHVFDSGDVDFLYLYLKRFRGLPGSPSLMQSNYVYDADGKTIVDYIGRFENLAEHVEDLKDKIGFDFELPYLNKTVHQPYQYCFTNPAVERVKTLWEIDFKNFGYEINAVE